MEYACFPVGVLQANCYLLWDEDHHAVMIDPGAEAERLTRAVSERALSVEAILLTHVHFDHIGAVAAMQDATGAPLFVHEGDREALTDGRLSLHTAFGEPYPILTADRLLKDGDTVCAGALDLQVIATPGHTPGSCCYRAGDLLFSGDTLFCGSIGRVDFVGGSMQEMQNSLKKLCALPPALCVLPGHGEATTIADERAQNPFLQGV